MNTKPGECCGHIDGILFDDSDVCSHCGYTRDEHIAYRELHVITTVEEKDITFKWIKELKKVSRKELLPIYARFIKCVEELGEAGAAHLYESNSINKSASAGESSFEEEMCDVVVCAFDILFAAGSTFEDIAKIMKKKIKKWDDKLTRGDGING